MDKYSFKDKFKSYKSEIGKQKSELLKEDKKFIRNSEIIKSKLLTEDIQNEWKQMRRNQLNSQTEEHLIKISDESQKINVTEKVVDENIETESQEFKVTIVPEEAIKEISERNEKDRVVQVDKYSDEYKCNELYNWFLLMFQEWEKEIDRLPLEVKVGHEGREKFGIYKQCRGYIKPLLRLLKRREVTKIIMNKLFEVMVFCLDLDFIRAHNKYIELAIGNAPWPMGVTMVGIHERSGRSKIFTSQVAHILNDDNTKKYLLSVKRIMSLVQRLNPTSPSNQVVS